jgi:hypothetical protein
MAVSPSGKQSMMSSLNTWLTEQFPEGQVHDGFSTTLSMGKEFWIHFGFPLASLMFPSISISEVGLFTPGGRAFGRTLGIDSTTGKPIKGERNQTLIEINAWAKDTAESANAEKDVRDLRDKIMYALLNAGEWDEDTDDFLVPPILLKDYSEMTPPTVGVIKVDSTANSINERFIVDPVNANVKRYKLLVRVYWEELS